MTDSPVDSLPDDDLESQDIERDVAAVSSALRRSFAVLAVIAVVAVPMVWWLARPSAQPKVQASVVALPELREKPKVEMPHTPFAEIGRQAGLAFVQENGAAGEKLLPETMGGGCAFLDFDNDGDQDILLVNSCRWPWDTGPEKLGPEKLGPAKPSSTMCLLANDGKGQFTDVTEQAGLKVSFYGMGVAVGDYDNDGRADLFITAVGPNHLYHNVGNRFVDVTEAAGVAGSPDAWSSGCGWFDYNNDGRLDLIVGNYVRWSREIDRVQDFRLVGVGRAYGPPNSFEGAFPNLYRNEGNGRFIDVSRESGIQVVNPYTGVPAAKTLGIAPVDLDGDGWIDLILANDTVQNFVFHNQRDGTFREIGAESGIAFDSAGNARGAMGIDVADFRNDHTLGVAIGNFANEMNSLYVAQGSPLSFVDASVATGLGPETRLQLTFGLFFVDYDLDGRLDLMMSNGHLEAEINKVQSSQQYAQSPQLFWNSGPEASSEFLRVTAEQCGPDLFQPIVGRGAAYADIDGDGDQDILLTSVADRPRLLRNDQQLGHRWLRFKLVGREANRDAIGAWVEVTADGDVLRRQVMPTRSYLSQCELPVVIGLGRRKQITKVQIRWPGGQIQDVTDFEPNRTIAVEQLTPSKK